MSDKEKQVILYLSEIIFDGYESSSEILVLLIQDTDEYQYIKILNLDDVIKDSTTINYTPLKGHNIISAVCADKEFNVEEIMCALEANIFFKEDE